MMPQPPGNDSAWRAGNGFQMSKTRKSIKPRSKYFQLRGATNDTAPREGKLVQTFSMGFHHIGTAQPRRMARYCPETSSMTTRWGSLMFQKVAARSALQVPIAASENAIMQWRMRSRSREWAGAAAGLNITPWSVNTLHNNVGPMSVPDTIQNGRTARRRPPRDPHVPGANGR